METRNIEPAGVRRVWLLSSSLAGRRRAAAAAFLSGLTVLGCGGTALAGSGLWELVSLLEHCLEWAARSGAPALRSGSPAERAVAAAPAALPPAAPAPPPRAAAGTPASAAPQDATPEHSERARPAGMAVPLEYHGAQCTGLFVYVVTLHEHSPRDSAVSFATSGSARARLAHPGQSVGDWEVLAITDDWTGTDPVVWLIRGDEVCRAGLTGNPARVQAPPKPRPKPRRRRPVRRRRR